MAYGWPGSLCVFMCRFKSALRLIVLWHTSQVTGVGLAGFLVRWALALV